MKAKDLDKKFDSGEDITEFLDMKNARRPGQEQKRVNVDLGTNEVRDNVDLGTVEVRDKS